MAFHVIFSSPEKEDFYSSWFSRIHNPHVTQLMQFDKD